MTQSSSIRSLSSPCSSGRRVLLPSLMRESSPRCSVASFSTKTKGDVELSSFLAREIEEEKKSRQGSAPPAVEGFEISTKGSEVVLTRKFNDESIRVELNVNHTVDTDEDPNFQDGQSAEGEMLSKPNFDVIIEKAGQKILLSCTFVQDEAAQHQEDDVDDLFQIVELSMYSDAEAKDSDYAVSGDIMDSKLYDLLMNMLDERGITNEFSEQLVEFCTSYEHGQYVGLLEKLRTFVSK